MKSYRSFALPLLGILLLTTPRMFSQNSIDVFAPVDLRLSQVGAGTGANQVLFNSSTLSLSCPAVPVAYLSSGASANPVQSTGNILVDNNIDVTNLTTSHGPVDVCTGGASSGNFQYCFNSTYWTPHNGTRIGMSLDPLAASLGVPPINISSFLTQGSQNLKIDLVDEGGGLGSSTVYLNTNCTSAGVNGPANISGNTIPPTNPPPATVNQNFNFDTGDQQIVGFQYNLSGALSAGTLTINPNGVTPIVTDSGVDATSGFPALVTGTSFATSECLVHNGEILNGSPACKLFTLECTTGNGNTATGAQCPVSTLSNEVLEDVFDGPAFTLPNIVGKTFTWHEGMGFLMASEGWTGGPCTFDPASGLQNLPCPQNLLTNFSGPGTFTGTGQTTHPNSQFISVAQVPEDLTQVGITNSQGVPDHFVYAAWGNSNNPYVTMISRPPDLTGTNLPHASSFVASPIASISYGISNAELPLPVPGTTTATDTVLLNPAGCPTPSQPNYPKASNFTPPLQHLAPLPDGYYWIHYAAKDCAGTEELQFTQNQSGAWTTNFYVYPLNIDTVAPEVASGPTLSPPGPYTPGQKVTVQYTCADAMSGVYTCGTFTFPTPPRNTGTLTGSFIAQGTGTQTFTVNVRDAAGNTASRSVNYTVN